MIEETLDSRSPPSDESGPLVLARADRLIPQCAAVTAMAAGCAALCGWIVGNDVLKSLVPGLVAMNPVTALAFVLLGLSLWLSILPPTGRRPALALGCGSVVVLIGLLKLCDVFLGWNSGIDRLLFTGALENMLAARIAVEQQLQIGTGGRSYTATAIAWRDRHWQERVQVCRGRLEVALTAAHVR